MNDKNSFETKKEIIKQNYQIGDVHFNSEGHKKIAEDFLRKFKF